MKKWTSSDRVSTGHFSDDIFLSPKTCFAFYIYISFSLCVLLWCRSSFIVLRVNQLECWDCCCTVICHSSLLVSMLRASMYQVTLPSQALSPHYKPTWQLFYARRHSVLGLYMCASVKSLLTACGYFTKFTTMMHLRTELNLWHFEVKGHSEST